MSQTVFFTVRYKIIFKDRVATAGDDKKRSTDLLTKYDKTKKEWQLGKTKASVLEELKTFVTAIFETCYEHTLYIEKQNVTFFSLGHLNSFSFARRKNK